MTNVPSEKRYDLEDRTYKFAKRAMVYVNSLPKTLSNLENGRQLARSAGSVGANYIEANEALSKKDFLVRIKICRKEAKESGFWIKLSEPETNQQDEREKLIQESTELTKIFGAIVVKSK